MCWKEAVVDTTRDKCKGWGDPGTCIFTNCKKNIYDLTIRSRSSWMRGNSSGASGEIPLFHSSNYMLIIKTNICTTFSIYTFFPPTFLLQKFQWLRHKCNFQSDQSVSLHPAHRANPRSQEAFSPQSPERSWPSPHPYSISSCVSVCAPGLPSQIPYG